MSKKKRKPLFGKPVKAVSVGLETFAESLREQEAEAVTVAWRPPARVPRLTHTRSGVEIDQANAEAVRRICAGRPMIVGLGLAREVISGLGERMLLHAGPPINLDELRQLTLNGIEAAFLPQEEKEGLRQQVMDT